VALGISHGRRGVWIDYEYGAHVAVSAVLIGMILSH
jgi:hypothetical protein